MDRFDEYAGCDEASRSCALLQSLSQQVEADIAMAQADSVRLGVDASLASVVGVSAPHLRSVKKNQLLIEVARPHLLQFEAFSRGSGLMCGLHDEHACNLDYSGDPAVIEAAEHMSAMQGSNWSIENVGCNAAGISAASNRLGLVQKGEHYLHALKDWSGVSVPIMSGKKFVGVFAIASNSERISDQTIVMATTVARSIGSDYRCRELEAKLQGAIMLIKDMPLGESPAAESRDECDLNLRNVEQRCIDAALKKTGGDMNEAAALLGISRATLYRRCKERSVQGRLGANGE